MIASHLIFISLIVAIACADSHPLAFFAEIDSSYLPLSYTPEEKDGGKKLSVLSFLKAGEPPVEFELQGKYVIAKDTFSPGPLGFFQGKVGFGPGVAMKPLKFDKQSRVLKNRFYLCRIENKHLYELTHGDSHRSTNFCFRAELYLLPYDKKTKTVAAKASKASKASKPKNRLSQRRKHLLKKIETILSGDGVS